MNVNRAVLACHVSREVLAVFCATSYRLNVSVWLNAWINEVFATDIRPDVFVTDLSRSLELVRGTGSGCQGQKLPLQSALLACPAESLLLPVL